MAAPSNADMARVVQGANIDPEVKKTIQAVLDVRAQQIAEGGSPPEAPGGVPPSGELPASVPADIAVLYEAVNGILGLLDTQATYINNVSQILNTEDALANKGSYPADCPINNQEMYSLGSPQTQG